MAFTKVCLTLTTREKHLHLIGQPDNSSCAATRVDGLENRQKMS